MANAGENYNDLGAFTSVVMTPDGVLIGYQAAAGSPSIPEVSTDGSILLHTDGTHPSSPPAVFPRKHWCACLYKDGGVWVAIVPEDIDRMFKYQTQQP